MATAPKPGMRKPQHAKSRMIVTVDGVENVAWFPLTFDEKASFRKHWGFSIGELLGAQGDSIDDMTVVAVLWLARRQAGDRRPPSRTHDEVQEIINSGDFAERVTFETDDGSDAGSDDPEA